MHSPSTTRFRRALVALTLGLWLAAMPARAQTPTPTQAAPPPAPPADTSAPVTPSADTLRLAGQPVVVGGDTLFRVYARLGPMTAAERAEAISGRVTEASRGLRAGADTLSVVEEEGQSLIVAGDRVLMAVLEEDARMAGVPRAELAAGYLTALGDAFTKGSLRWRLERFGLGLLFTLLTTAALVALGWLVLRVFRRLEAMISLLRQSQRLPSLKIQQLELLSADRIADALLIVARGLQVVVWAILLYFYLVLVLSFFPWTQEASGRILDYVLHPLGIVGRNIASYLPNLFFIAIIVIVTRYVLRTIHFIFGAIGSGAISFGGFDKDWAEPTYKLVRFLVLAFALIVLFPYLPGAKSDAFKGVSLFVGVLFSLGSTGAVANLVAGSLLTYTRAFQIGDRVKIGGTLGDVVARTLLVTKVRTVYNVEVTIPNSTVMSSEVLNFTTMAQSTGIIMQTTVTIGYDVPWRKVHDLLVKAAQTTEGVLKDPAPFVLQTGLNDYYPAYELNAYIRESSRLRVILSRMNERVQDVFAEAGVEITSPAFTAIRDGNAITLPEGSVPPGYTAPAFRVRQMGESGD